MTIYEKNLGRGRYIRAEAELVQVGNNARPYFSVTGEMGTKRFGREDFEIGGAIHEEISAHFPKLRPVIALHLADDRGVPMYAVENGVYFLGLSAYPDGKNLEAFKRLWRVTDEEVSAILDYIGTDANPSEALRFLMLDHTARWLAEANAARDIVGELVAR